MGVVVLSDIHGNSVALEAVLADIERDPVTQILCLGDVAGTGPHPVQCIDRLRSLDCPVVMGNVDETLLAPPAPDELDDLADAALVFAEIDRWCADQLSAEHERFIRSFEPTLEYESPAGTRFFCYHGSPRSPTDEVSATTAEETLDDQFGTVDAHVLAGGHTHLPFSRRYKGSILLNPGSVGLPYEWDRAQGRYRNPPWAEYAVVAGGPDVLRVELRRCAVDVPTVVEAALESDMPHAERWADGWRAGS